jgi:hypothetical protein
MYQSKITSLNKELLQLNLYSLLVFDKWLLKLIASLELLNIFRFRSNKLLTYSQHKLKLRILQNHLNILTRLMQAKRNS